MFICRKETKGVIIYICLAAFLILCIRNFEQLVGWAANLWNVMFPLVLGMIMAYVLNIVLVRVERLYFPRSRKPDCGEDTARCGNRDFDSAGTCAVYPDSETGHSGTGKGVRRDRKGVPVFLEQVSAWLEANGAFNISDYLNLETIDWKDLMDKALSVVRSGIGSVLSSTISVVGSVVGGVVNFFIGLIFGIYILAGEGTARCSGEEHSARLSEGGYGERNLPCSGYRE